MMVGRKAGIEWINRRRLLRGAERLTDDQRTTLFAKLLTADPGEDIAVVFRDKDSRRAVAACDSFSDRYSRRFWLFRLGGGLV
jgi:hypothetical protein